MVNCILRKAIRSGASFLNNLSVTQVAIMSHSLHTSSAEVSSEFGIANLLQKTQSYNDIQVKRPTSNKN